MVKFIKTFIQLNLMFDFLNENKRQFLLNHPVLGRISSSPQAISSFIDNLSAFESDLCSPLSKDGQKPKEMIFTKNEIERIKSYIQKVFSKEILELSNKIFHHAGFELWVHAGHREDLNDWMKGEKYYIRGFHNFYESMYEQHLKAPEDIMGVPLNLLLSSRIAEQFNISPETPRHASVGKITFPFLHEPYDLENIFRWEDFEMDDLGHGSVSLRRKNPLLVYPFYLRCALFCLDQKWDIMRTQVGMKKKKIIERGFLGLKKVREIDEPVISSQRVFKGGSFLPLNQIVNTNSNNPAYLPSFFFPKF